MSEARYQTLTDAGRTPSEETIEYRGHDGMRHIGLADGLLVEVGAESGWEEFPDAAALLEKREVLEAWRRDLFRDRGRLSIERAEGSDDALVCHCQRIARAIVADALADGKAVDAVIAETGAGSVCGGCVPDIEGMAGVAAMQPARLIAKQPLDSRHMRLRFAIAAPAATALPGANLRLEATIAVRRLARSYTLTDADARRGTREIIVRRDPNGLVSRWLQDHADADAEIALSAPLGGAAVEGDRPLAFAAAGVGVTPVMSRLRALRRIGGGRLRLHWSARCEGDSTLLREVRDLVDAVPGAELVLHDTERHGRMEAADWAAFAAAAAPGEELTLCGPLAFMDAAEAALRGSGWPAERLGRESFAAGPGAPPLKRVERFDHHEEPVQAESFRLAPSRSVLEEARVFLRQFYHEHGAPTSFESRTAEVEAAIAATGTYVQTYDELAYGARLAWRNTARCIGRFFWHTLTVFDARAAATETQVFEAVLRHLRFATNGGDLRPAITVLRPGAPRIRIVNPQLILYAGYRQPDGSVVGDPKNTDLTDLARALGWRGRGTRFDVLPLIIRVGERAPRLFELPAEDVLEVAMEHPEAPAFADLGLQWFAVPAVADMALDVGGVQYTAAPSSGFYMGTEIGSFNFGQSDRYDTLPDMARALGIATGDDNPLWRDQAVTESNRAVLHSFKKAGVRILDHHTLAAYFTRFQQEEAAKNRPVYGHWPWIVPPMSSNLADVWHDASLKKVILKPNYFYQPRDDWKSLAEARAAS